MQINFVSKLGDDSAFAFGAHVESCDGDDIIITCEQARAIFDRLAELLRVSALFTTRVQED